MPDERPVVRSLSPVEEPSVFDFLVRHFRAVGFTRDAVGQHPAGDVRFAARR